jgi:valyl-tRNA synthetase
MKGNIDVAAEKSRLARQRQKLDSDLARSRQKLGNADFVNNAPAAVVSKETERAEEFARQLGLIDEQLAKLDAFS